MARIIGIVSGKGGVGKTTVGINLGATLAKHFEKNVALVDCNVTTSHVGLYLGMYYCPVTLNKVLRGEHKIEEAINFHYSGLNVVPASLSLSDLEGVDITKLRSSIKGLFENNDYVLLDIAPGLGREAIAGMKACDEILYVTHPFIPSTMDIVRTEEVVRELDLKSLGIVVNMSHKKQYEMSKNEIEELTKLPVIATIPYDTHVHKSLNLKMPLVMLHPNHRVSKEMYKVASHLTGEVYEIEGSFKKILKSIKKMFKKKEKPKKAEVSEDLNT